MAVICALLRWHSPSSWLSLHHSINIYKVASIHQVHGTRQMRSLCLELGGWGGRWSEGYFGQSGQGQASLKVENETGNELEKKYFQLEASIINPTSQGTVQLWEAEGLISGPAGFSWQEDTRTPASTPLHPSHPLSTTRYVGRKWNSREPWTQTGDREDPGWMWKGEEDADVAQRGHWGLKQGWPPVLLLSGRSP